MNIVAFLVIILLNNGEPSMGVSSPTSPEQCEKAARSFIAEFTATHPGEWFEVGCIATRVPAKT